MFGKLFGYLSLIRSGKIEKDKVSVLLIVDRLLELHNRKGWIREVVCESMLTLLNVISSDIIVLVIPKLKQLLGNGLLAISDMTAWQLMLCVGIQQISSASSTDIVKTEMLELLPQPDIVTPASFSEMIPTLLEATAGFPKVRQLISVSTFEHTTSTHLFLISGLRIYSRHLLYLLALLFKILTEVFFANTHNLPICLFSSAASRVGLHHECSLPYGQRQSAPQKKVSNLKD